MARIEAENPHEPGHPNGARTEQYRVPAPAEPGGAGDVFVSRNQLPEGDFVRYRKTYAPRAIRMEGTFHCLTSEGNVASCTDGWLAIDSKGFPYPINAEEFALTYEPIDEH